MCVAALMTVGVSRAALGLPPRRSLMRTPGWGTSSKQALMRAKTIAGARRDKRMDPSHLLLGLVRAEAGTVPRVLAFAGVDTAELAARAEAALDRGD